MGSHRRIVRGRGHRRSKPGTGNQRRRRSDAVRRGRAGHDAEPGATDRGQHRAGDAVAACCRRHRAHCPGGTDRWHHDHDRDGRARARASARAHGVHRCRRRRYGGNPLDRQWRSAAGIQARQWRLRQPARYPDRVARLAGNGRNPGRSFLADRHLSDRCRGRRWHRVRLHLRDRAGRRRGPGRGQARRPSDAVRKYRTGRRDVAGNMGPAAHRCTGAAGQPRRVLRRPRAGRRPGRSIRRTVHGADHGRVDFRCRCCRRHPDTARCAAAVRLAAAR